ncbi:uncharacterized protein LOC119917331 [Micropterus salmoides]|uniref:uncharacterized protein LOC119917331 n=1 Tax=Micropterus salmoides TaxID=27706 RepID=UPI0018EA77A8|nr:uncharacterized protein LOC119917331 [Micropterus salmoides]
MCVMIPCCLPTRHVSLHHWIPISVWTAFVFLDFVISHSVFGYFPRCSAQDLPCTITQDAGQTRYSVPQFKTTNCYYWWTNSTKHMLANHKGKSGEVVMKSNWSLLISGCSESIHYERDCVSEIPRKANCITNCSPSAVLQNGGGISRNHWVTVSFVTILLLLLVVGILLYSFKNSICRKMQKRFNAGVKVQNNPPNTAEEEEQRV